MISRDGSVMFDVGRGGGGRTHAGVEVSCDLQVVSGDRFSW